MSIEKVLTQIFIFGANLGFFFLIFKIRGEIFSLWRAHSLSHLKKLKISWESEISRLLISQEANFKKIQLPDFKFYSRLCGELLFEAQRTGLEYQSSLCELREQAQKDFQFSFHVLDSFWQVIWQLLLISFMTWGFLLALSSIFEEPLSWPIMLGIGGLQLMGFMIFLLGFQFFRSRNERKFSPYFFSLYFFKEFLKMNLPLQYLCEKSGVLKLLERRKGFPEIEEALKSLIGQILKEGGYGVQERFELILSELRYLQLKDFEKVKQRVQILKMGIILFFFVPAYLLNIFSMVQRMM